MERYERQGYNSMISKKETNYKQKMGVKANIKRKCIKQNANGR